MIERKLGKTEKYFSSRLAKKLEKWFNSVGNYFVFESIKKAYTVKILKISLVVKKV